MDTLKISTTLINGILAYLGKRPYEETFQLIQAIQKEAQDQISPPKGENDE